MKAFCLRHLYQFRNVGSYELVLAPRASPTTSVVVVAAHVFTGLELFPLLESFDVTTTWTLQHECPLVAPSLVNHVESPVDIVVALLNGQLLVGSEVDQSPRLLC